MRPCYPFAVTANSPSSGGESAAHRNLKRLALAWARARRLVLAATEVRLPRANYRADVVAATPRSLSEGAFTVVFECKASRSDFLRDSAAETGAEEHIAALAGRLAELRALIAGHRPDLRRGEELFAEFDAYDLRGLRHDPHDRIEAELRAAQRKLHDGTKFAKLSRWRAASLLYVVTEEGILTSPDVPDGWGWLVKRGDALALMAKPCLNPTTPEQRVALVERIAARAHRLAE
ncbi:MAG: hypothetical protein QG602_490 [Verrucomicrobiota bacterium]|nr:hypothetical protein [Verrucomicrobiota bacterium]